MIQTLIRAVCAICRFFAPGRFRYTRDVEGNAPYMDWREKLWWGYKAFYRPAMRAEKGSGIEEHFAAQRFDLTPPEGFVPAQSATLAMGGDVLATAHIRFDNTAHLWDETADLLWAADAVCINLESPVSASNPVSQLPKNVLAPPPLNNSPEILQRFSPMADGGGIFSTANNHALDMGVQGLCETLDELDHRGFLHTGTARSAAEQATIPVLDKNGIRFAFLSYTFSINGRDFPADQPYLVNYLRLNTPDFDRTPIIEAARRAKTELHADVVVAMLHWGLESESYPARYQMALGRELLAAGVDVIVGNHPHQIQPAETVLVRDAVTGDEKRGVIFYALGDLLSWQGDTVINSFAGLVARLKFEKGTFGGKKMTIVSGITVRPFYISRTVENGVCTDYRLLDLLGLDAALGRGENPRGLSAKQQRAVRRLTNIARAAVPDSY